MRLKLRFPNVAWSAFSFTAVALAALSPGCDSGGGGAAPSPEAKQASEAQKDTLQKNVEEINAATSKKGGAKVQFHAKPGAVGGN